MLERFRRSSNSDDGNRGGVATAERSAADRERARADRTAVREPARTERGAPVGDPETARRVRARQREEFGGINWGSAFFGWLVAVGMAAILLILVLAAAYYCGGYVSGRMSRFDGGRQGLAVWAIGLAVTIVLAVAGALFGAEYNVLEQLNLPRIPVEEGSLTAGAAIALAAVLLGTLIAAMGGGKAGERFHRKVDRAGYGV